MTEGHHAVVLTGDVTEERINHRSAGESFDVVHFLSEATNDGIAMTNWTMPPRQVAQLARHVRAEMVYLSLSQSVFLPQYLIDQHIPAVLSHMSDAREALRVATYFYQELIRTGGDMHKAYEKVSQRDGTLAWSSNGSYLGALEPLARELKEMGEREAERLKREVRRERDFRIIGLLTGLDTAAVVALLAGMERGEVLEMFKQLLSVLGGG